MTIRTILDNKELSATDKLVAVNEIVTNIRAEYGNTNINIEVEGFNTINGIVDLYILSEEDKLTLIRDEYMKCIISASESCKETKGVILDRTIESAIATNNILVNISADSGSKYI